MANMSTWAMIQNGVVSDVVPASYPDLRNPAFIWTDVTNYTVMPIAGYTTTDNVTFISPDKQITASPNN